MYLFKGIELDIIQYGVLCTDTLFYQETILMLFYVLKNTRFINKGNPQKKEDKH